MEFMKIALMTEIHKDFKLTEFVQSMIKKNLLGNKTEGKGSTKKLKTNQVRKKY